MGSAPTTGRFPATRDVVNRWRSSEEPVSKPSSYGLLYRCTGAIAERFAVAPALTTVRISPGVDPGADFSPRCDACAKTRARRPRSRSRSRRACVGRCSFVVLPRRAVGPRRSTARRRRALRFADSRSRSESRSLRSVIGPISAFRPHRVFLRCICCLQRGEHRGRIRVRSFRPTARHTPLVINYHN